MNWRERIVCNPEILCGKPTIKGTRISVELILQGFASGWRTEDILEAYPHLSPEDVLAALACAGESYMPTASIHCPRPRTKARLIIPDS